MIANGGHNTTESPSNFAQPHSLSMAQKTSTGGTAPAQNGNLRAILDQFSDISRYANIIADNIQTTNYTSDLAPSSQQAAPAIDGNSLTHAPATTMLSHLNHTPAGAFSFVNNIGSSNTVSGSSSSLSDVLSSLMGLSEDEWRTLRDSMKFLQTTPRPLLLTTSLVDVASAIQQRVSPEDAFILTSIDDNNQPTILTNPWLTLLPLIYWLLIVLGVVGNVIVILVYAFGRQWRSDLSVYLVNLAVADAMLAIFCLPFTMNQVIEHEWPYSDWMCDLVFYLQLASVLSSVYTLVVIGVDRYMFIIYQKKNRRLSKTTKLLVIIVGWMVTFSVCSVQIFVADVHTIVDQRTGRLHRSCSENLGNMNVAYTIAIFLLTYAIPLVVLASAYYMVGRKLSQMMSEVPPDDASPGTAASASNNWSTNNNNLNTRHTIDEQQHNQLLRPSSLRPTQYGQTTAMPSIRSQQQQQLTASAALPGQYGNRVVVGARAATAAPPHRMPVRADFLRLDPRYNLCRTPEMKRIRQKRRIVRMLIVLVILFAISWLPLHSFFLLFTFCEHWFHMAATPSSSSSSSTIAASSFDSSNTPRMPTQLNPELIQIVFIPSHVLAMSSCCVNPIVYCFMSRRFRNDLVKLWRRATSTLLKVLKKVFCYCCTRDDSDYWSHASSFHVVGAVMDEDDGSYAICTTCKDHQHHHNSKCNDNNNNNNGPTQSLMANGGGQQSRSGGAVTGGGAGLIGDGGSINNKSVLIHHEPSFCDNNKKNSTSRNSPDAVSGADNNNKTSSVLGVSGNYNNSSGQNQQDEHDVFMASYPLKLSQKDFAKLFSKPIDHKMIRQLSGSINWSHGPINSAAAGRDGLSEVTDNVSKGSHGAMVGGSDSVVIGTEKNPMACFYMCTTCGHLYPVFTNKMPKLSSKSNAIFKATITTATTTVNSGTDTKSANSTRLNAHPNAISHSASSTSATRAAARRHNKLHHHGHDALLRTSSLTFSEQQDDGSSSSTAAAAAGLQMTKRACTSCIVNDGASSIGSSGGASSSIAAAPRVVLERCSSTRLRSGDGAENTINNVATAALRPLLQRYQQQQQQPSVLLKKQCSACKSRREPMKKKQILSNIQNGVNSVSQSSRNSGSMRPYKSPKELYD